MPAIAIMLALLTQAGPRLDQAILRPAVNLVSNCSFEAVNDAGMPAGWDLSGAAADFRMTTRGARHGSRCLTVMATAGENPMPSARQTVEITPGVEYVLTAWLRVDRASGGPVKVALKFIDSQSQELASFDGEASGAGDAWAPVEVRGKAPLASASAVVVVPSLIGPAEVEIDAVSLRRTDGKPAVHEALYVKDLRVAYAQPHWIRLKWTSNAARSRVEWQPTEGGAPLKHADGILEQSYGVIGLKPATEYRCRVVAVRPKFYDERGRAVVVAKPAQAQILASTKADRPRVWAGFRLWPSAPLGALPTGTSYPSIVCGGDRLYVAEVRDGGIYVSRVVPGTLAIEWTKVVVDSEAGVWRGMTDLAWSNDKLWITWTGRSTGAGPAGQQRQYVMLFDPATGEHGQIVEVKPSRAGATTGPGGLASSETQMWMTYLQSWTEGGVERSEIAVAPLDSDGDPGEPVVCKDCGTQRPTGPCIAPFGGDMQLLYSDRGGLGDRTGWEPLLWTSFDGETFGGLRRIGGSGRSRYPKAVNLGRVTLAACMSNRSWTQYGERFYDIVLVKLGPGAGDIDTLAYAGDMKYNANPDLTVCDGTIYVVYTKMAHAPDGSPAPRDYGTYIGKITQEIAGGG